MKMIFLRLQILFKKKLNSINNNIEKSINDISDYNLKNIL